MKVRLPGKPLSQAGLARLRLVVVTALLLVSAPNAQTPSTDASVGVWPWLVGNIDGSIPQIITDAQQTGLDTIYIHLYRTSGPSAGTLYMTDESGTWNPSLGTVTPYLTLTSLISQAHAAGLQVIGVVNCFLDGGPLPGNAAHEAHLLAVIDYLVHTYQGTGAPFYDLDGVCLDRVRFYSGLTNSHQTVTAFVAQVKQKIGLLPLHAYLAANLWHIDGPPYDGSFRSYTEAMGLLQNQYGQHWANLSQYLDVNLPMAYIAEGSLYGSNHALMQAYLTIVAMYANQAAQAGGYPNQRIVPCIRFWNDSNGTTTAASVNACYTGALNGGADGVMAFRYFTALGQTSWWNALAALTDPGPDLPLASLTGTPGVGLTAQVNASASTPNAGPVQFRYDLDGDGLPDGAWSSTTSQTLLLPQAGFMRVAVEVEDGAQKRATARRQVNIPTSTMTAGPGLISTSLGGSMGLAVGFGPGAAGFTYVMAGTLSGTTPGTPATPLVTIPLNFDAFTDVTLEYANSVFLQNTFGILDAGGAATATVWFPPGALPPSLAWITFAFATVGIGPGTTPFLVASNAASFTIFP